MSLSFFFFFNDTATTEIYTLSLHDALPIYPILTSLSVQETEAELRDSRATLEKRLQRPVAQLSRSEEHTSELQSRLHLVCRLLLEKKNNTLSNPCTCAYIALTTFSACDHTP